MLNYIYFYNDDLGYILVQIIYFNYVYNYS